MALDEQTRLSEGYVLLGLSDDSIDASNGQEFLPEMTDRTIKPRRRKEPSNYSPGPTREELRTQAEHLRETLEGSSLFSFVLPPEDGGLTPHKRSRPYM